MNPCMRVMLTVVVAGALEAGCASTIRPRSHAATAEAAAPAPHSATTAAAQTSAALALAAEPADRLPPVAPEDFALMPWGTSPGDPEALAWIKACGFNMAGFLAPHDLDAAHALGMKAFVHDPSVVARGPNLSLDEAETERRVAALTQRVASHPAVFGYYVCDEPFPKDYPSLAQWSNAFRRHAPESLVYINLLPNYLPHAWLKDWGMTRYEDYLEAFIAEVNPRFISYDHYALMDDGTLRHGYFQNLESMRAVAMKHDLPFWNIVLGNAHFRYAEPTSAGLRFQAFTTLAYGARGLSYFTYFTPAIGNYRLGPIDQFGHKTPTWDMMRNVNWQVRMLLPTYLTLTSVNVFHHPDIPEGCRGIEASAHLKALDGGKFVVGEFQNAGGTPYVLIVNKDLHDSCSFSFAFKENGTVEQINAYTGNATPYGGENNWLAAGQGMLLRVRPEKH